MTSFFSVMSPPVRIGSPVSCRTLRSIDGISPGRMSMASGLRFFALSAESSAMESIRKTRRIAIIFSSFARWIMFARVEIMPSACVLRRRKSTEISFAARPLIRSAWTMAIFPASLICRTISEILQISP